LISALEKGKQPEKALEILKEMKQHSIVPNVITYNAWISALEKGKPPLVIQEMSQTKPCPATLLASQMRHKFRPTPRHHQQQQ